MLKVFPYFFLLALIWGCGLDLVSLKVLRERESYKEQSIKLAKKVRLLKVENSNLKVQLNRFQMENKYLSTIDRKKYLHWNEGRRPSNDQIKLDYVRFKDYSWSAEELKFVAEIEYERNDFEKSSQFYHTLLKEYKKNIIINDEVIFYAALSAFQSGNHYDWSNKYFSKLIKEYPDSHYYLVSKIWMIITLYKTGKKESFKKEIKKFEERYGNTQEWEMLRKYK